MSAEVLALRSPRLDRRTLAWVGGLALALLAVRAALRGIHVPGHAALPALGAFVLAQERLRVQGAALAVALSAGALGALGGFGSVGAFASWLLAALVVDAAAWRSPDFASRLVTCALIGALAGSLRILLDLPVLFSGAADLGAPALLSLAGHAGFGALGAALVPLLRRRSSDRSALG